MLFVGSARHLPFSLFSACLKLATDNTCIREQHITFSILKLKNPGSAIAAFFIPDNTNNEVQSGENRGTKALVRMRTFHNE
jgi:hypothetical protein